MMTTMAMVFLIGWNHRHCDEVNSLEKSNLRDVEDDFKQFIKKIREAESKKTRQDKAAIITKQLKNLVE